MATFEQLGSEQRAILELVLKQGQSYEELSGVLGMSESRIRELARAALVELAPATAERVDPEWRGQLGDYVLGQQTGPESRATRGHLKSSESARMWSLSLVDSLDDLYRDASRPEIPEPGSGSDSPRAPSRIGRIGRRSGGAAADPRTSDEPADAERREPGATSSGGSALSPAARGIVRRRRIVAAAVAGTAVLIAVLVGVFLLRGSDEPDRSASSSRPPPARPAASGPRILAQIPLRPLPGEKGQGQAVIAEQEGQRVVVVQAESLSTFGSGELLEVWFYNSRSDAKSVGAQKVEGGKFQGLGALPADFQKYRYIDLSREKADRRPAHSGDSVMRGALADAQQPSGPLPGAPGPPGATGPGSAPSP